MPVETARAYITAHYRLVREEREQRREREAAAAANDPVPAERARLRARQAAQADNPDMPALAAMLALDPDNKLARAGRAMDDMLTGGIVRHRIKRED